MSARASSALSIASAKQFAAGYVDFTNKSPTPFHAVGNIVEMLVARGYEEISETVVWPPLNQGGKYFVRRNGSSIIAFSIGGQYVKERGFKIVGGHTDSPNFQLKPKSHTKKGSMVGVGVQCYGGGLWHTWFDRELTVAGRVVLQKGADSRLSSALVHIPKPLMRIPTLAIHLRTQAERDAFGPNKETHLVPLMATEKAIQEAFQDPSLPTTGEQSPLLMKILSDSLGCSVEDIVDFDLSVVDTQPAVIGGALDEFVFAPRIDNLASCYCGIHALLKADETLATDDQVRMVALFDHEEVGSESAQGAAGSFVTDLVERFSAPNTSTRAAAIANSFLFSVDCAHAAHPNYLDKHEESHRPVIHSGPAIKYNANVRYATNGYTGAVVKALAKRSATPVQSFCVKNDSPCGSTIGPILSTLSGIAAVDIGIPMLSMHSIRETCGTVDLMHLTNLLECFFNEFDQVRQA
jgi:aspartyl aminopeptidase